MSDDNLARRHNVTITTSGLHPDGWDGATPDVLLNDTAHQLHGQPLSHFITTPLFSTASLTATEDQDWYAIQFPSPTAFNCLEMTMGLPSGSGGWWTSLAVETQAATGEWHRVDNLRTIPPYTFDDRRGERRPFETYALSFDATTAQAVRVVGCPGGPARFTSLARLAVYQRDRSRWDPKQGNPPMPRSFQLLAPNVIWDLCEHLTTLSGITVTFSFIEYYLDAGRYAQYWRRASPSRWPLVAVGLDQATSAATEANPVVRSLFDDWLAFAIIPVVVEDQNLGQLATEPVVLSEARDWDRQRRVAKALPMAWHDFRAALERAPQRTREQLESTAAMMGLIASTLSQQAQRAASLAHHLNGMGLHADHKGQAQQALVRQATDFMEKNLEAHIGVADVARALGFSLPYFSTQFTEITGRNPRDYLIELRIERAKDYLIHTPMTVREICAVLGYSRHHFSRLFKQRTGYPPEEFARRTRLNGGNGSRSSHS